jgi:Tfp pilus assembly protein PilE
MTVETHLQKASAVIMAVMQALERALRTGTVLLTAAQADALWSVGCGDAIEDAKQAINRYMAIHTSPQGNTCV